MENYWKIIQHFQRILFKEEHSYILKAEKAMLIAFSVSSRGGEL